MDELLGLGGDDYDYAAPEEGYAPPPRERLRAGVNAVRAGNAFAAAGDEKRQTDELLGLMDEEEELWEGVARCPSPLPAPTTTTTTPPLPAQPRVACLPACARWYGGVGERAPRAAAAVMASRTESGGRGGFSAWIPAVIPSMGTAMETRAPMARSVHHSKRPQHPVGDAGLWLQAQLPGSAARADGDGADAVEEGECHTATAAGADTAAEGHGRLRDGDAAAAGR